MPKGVGVQVPPRAEGKICRATICHTFDRFSVLNRYIARVARKPLKRSAGKASTVTVYERSDGRYQISWYDETGARRFASCSSMVEAKSFQAQKIEELERRQQGRFSPDDRETYSLARDLASSHGYTVLQAVQEWSHSKGRSQALPLGEIIQRFLADKSNESAAYTDKLRDDMLLVQLYFGADRPIDRIQSEQIEDFLDSRKSGSRRRNNLRSEIITLFRYAQNRLRALPRERKTEAELIERLKQKRTSVPTFAPEEFQLFLGAVREEWLPWLVIGGLSGVRTDGEIFRTTWEFFKWDRRYIDLPPEVTKNNERRQVPICDRLFDLLQPLRRKSGPVVLLKKPEDETARLRRVTGIPWRTNALRHSFCSYRVAITGNIPLVSIESGNSPAMIKRCYLDVKRFDEGLKWFELALPIPVGRRQEPFLMPLLSFGA